MLLKYLLQRHLLWCLFLILAAPAAAQLKADFSVDKTGGCSPLTVSFNNTTTGATAAATYKWDLGNNNSSSLKNPGATYRDEKTYTITLTVTDGGSTSTKQQSITVYKKPTVDFAASTAKGCLPLNVSFNSKSAAGDGSISNYFWDFGDGGTDQGSGKQQVSHTYNFEQQASVSLTVTNSHGCFNTLQKANVVQVVPGVKAAFSADKTTLCQVSDAVQFRNNSTGSGALTYSWDFGDGKTSTDKDPLHVYGKKGVYTIKLTVKSADGCSDVATQSNYINVANFTTDFDVPNLICSGTMATFTNKSSPVPTQSIWQSSEGGVAYSYNGSAGNLHFSRAGTFTVKLTNTFGSCQVTEEKTVTVKESPAVSNFDMDMNGVCGAPVTLKFKDNTPGAVKWQWNFNSGFNNTSVHATTQAPSYNYTSDGYYYVGLTVTNAAGCSGSATQQLYLYKPQVSIYYLSSTSPGGNSGCPGFTIKFAASSGADGIKEYSWDFGDGNTATSAQPEHTFNKVGTYNVRLSYTTNGGCKDVATYPVFVYSKPKADFVSATEVCGNTPVQFNDRSTGTVTGWQWDFGDQSYNYNGLSNPVHQYYNDGAYTVGLTVFNGTCSDRVEKKDYIKVKPPFPKIASAYNTCEGTRGAVTFTQASRQAEQWQWDFGDGTIQKLNEAQTEIKHTYNKTGSYKVVLSTTNGACTVKDSMNVQVLLKQKPVLSSTKTEVCSSDELDIKINGLEKNPYPYDYSYSNHYYFSRMEYGDGTTFSLPYYSSWSTVFDGRLNNLEVDKENIRIILTSSFFNCADTTNYIPLKVKGPQPSFNIVANNVCYTAPVKFEDASNSRNNVAIKTWEWSYGDTKKETFSNGNEVSHLYAEPGTYYPQLKVTDADGCHASTSLYNPVNVSGPKASFIVSPQNAFPNSLISFTNTTNYSYDYYNTNYKWLFGDGTVATDYYAYKIYPQVGVDTVKLVATNRQTGCSDTAVQLVYIKDVTAAFNYTSSYINTNRCPPMLVRFNNASTNANRVRWDFGDGSKADNQNFPSHTYSNAGVYKVVLYAYGLNDAMDSVVQYITVNGPYAILKADVLSGCLKQTVTLSAEVKNATSFTWDFGDGTLQETRDTFAVHAYQTAGVYTASIILKDGNGCSSTSDMQEKIIIDSLNIKLPQLPLRVCEGAELAFKPDITSIAASELQQQLHYKWTFGTGATGDASTVANPDFTYVKAGAYNVKLEVTSPYGCVKETEGLVTVSERVSGTISGPSQICEGVAASFKGAVPAGKTVDWLWLYSNGQSTGEQEPAAQLFTEAGMQTVKLVVDHQGCKDTTAVPLQVHPKPVVTVASAQSVICLGNTVNLTASGGATYAWLPSAEMQGAQAANTVAKPSFTTTYTVNVTSAFGCENKDSVTVTVVQPLQLKALRDTFVCLGGQVKLQASGAATYSWINETTGLSATTSANPIAAPHATTTYTVVGYDAHQCFTDTAQIQVVVQPRPTINAGDDLELIAGDTRQLHPKGSADVTAWSWSPGDFLSCTNCAAPLLTPRQSRTYEVKVKNKYGCEATDSIAVKLLCTDAHIYIPNSFTPNNDGKNDVFYIMGKGVSLVKSIRIYSRWGELMFEKRNFYMDDRASAWDGKFKGMPVPTGSYVYVTELQCESGEQFVRQGTVTVIH